MKSNNILTMTVLLACFAAAGCNAKSTTSATTEEKSAMTQSAKGTESSMTE